MGLLTGLLTLPLAPGKGLVWVLDRVVEEAEAELYDPERIRRDLAEAELAFEQGELGEREYESLEEELLARLVIAREREEGPLT
jgi:Gas vesicle protein G